MEKEITAEVLRCAQDDRVVFKVRRCDREQLRFPAAGGWVGAWASWGAAVQRPYNVVPSPNNVPSIRETRDER